MHSNFDDKKIVEISGHYEVHTSSGQFVLSGDSWGECSQDLKVMAEAKKLQPVSA